MALVSEIEDLLVEARSGNRRSLSRLLTLVEEGHNPPIERGIGSVSYTHLTLPTILLV